MTKGIDVLSHELVPKHELMSGSEKKELLEKLGATVRELPKISSDDPALRSIDTNRGDIIRITRKSQTAGHSFYYRVVA